MFIGFPILLMMCGFVYTTNLYFRDKVRASKQAKRQTVLVYRRLLRARIFHNVVSRYSFTFFLPFYLFYFFRSLFHSFSFFFDSCLSVVVIFFTFRACMFSDIMLIIVIYVVTAVTIHRQSLKIKIYRKLNEINKR